MQYVVRSPDNMVEKIDSFVDGGRFKSRNQLINVILADWIAREVYPINPHGDPYLDLEDAEMWVKRDRDRTRQEMLGDEFDRYRNQKADILDGDWAERRAFEEMERVSREREQWEKLKSEIRDELKGELLDTLRAELRGKSPEKSEGHNEQRKPKRKRKTTKPKTSG